jgi:adenine-specific DNA-methyltransferase
MRDERFVDVSSGGVRLELVWPGKDKFLLSPKDESGKPVWVEPDHPAAQEVRISDFTGSIGEVNADNPYADNLLFTGDSLDVLRILNEVPEYRREYRGKIKLIYIDPPFNTGQTFAHYDDWMEHSTWLSFMRDRLLLMRDLLAPDGSIWVHLDDAEQHRMRCLLDEVFGPGNFIETVVWSRADVPRSVAKFISNDQDYVAVYAKDAARLRFNLLPRDARSNAAYRNPDDDLRGPYRLSPCTATKPYRLGQYEVTGPSGRTHLPPNGRYWAIPQSRFEELDSDGRIWWGKDGNAAPMKKTFLSEVSDLTPRSLWHYEDVGSSRTARYESKKLFGAAAFFATPKPESFIERVLRIATDPGDIVGDVFGGSGTTAAVAHKMGRRWLTAEVLSDTVTDYTLPRLSKVVAGEDLGGITEDIGWVGGGGFRQVAVGPTMYQVTDYGVLLADWATNGRFARAVAGQLGFDVQSRKYAPFCGARGRMRICVLDGALGSEEVRQVVDALAENERVTIVAKVVLPGAEELLTDLSKGSRVRKAPTDLLTDTARRRRRGGVS